MSKYPVGRYPTSAPYTSANERNVWMLRHDNSMLASSAHCERTEANERPVLPSAGPSNCSTTTTRFPAFARWYAQLAPMAPAPMTTTSAVSDGGIVNSHCRRCHDLMHAA